MPDEPAQAAAEPAQMGRPWWTLTEVADRCGVSRSTVRRYREDGKFPSARKDPATGGWLVPVEDCLAAGLKPTAPTIPLRPDQESSPTTTPPAQDDRAHELERELTEARSALAVERAHRAAAEQLADERERHLSDLRQVLRMLELGPTPTTAAAPTPEPSPTVDLQPDTPEPPRPGFWRRLLG